MEGGGGGEGGGWGEDVEKIMGERKEKLAVCLWIFDLRRGQRVNSDPESVLIRIQAKLL